MKITSIETLFLRHRLPRAIGLSTLLYSFREAILVKVRTDDGIVGWEETGALGGVQSLINECLGPSLIGQDPLRHRQLWRQLWGPNCGHGWEGDCTPHCCARAIVNAATVHLLSLLPASSCSRTTEPPMLELDVSENPFREEVVSKPIKVEEGFVQVPKAPGLGVEVLEEVIRRYAVPV